MPTRSQQPFILCDGSRGIYAPQHVARIIINTRDQWSNVDWEAVAVCLAGPDTPTYWEAYDELDEVATLTNDDGTFILRWNPEYSDAVMVPSTWTWNDEMNWFEEATA